MATIHRFEDLLCWQKARELDNAVNKVTQYRAFSKNRALVIQIERASGSVMDCIAEGFGRDGNKEFRQKLSEAKASSQEVKSQLHRALARKYISEEEHAAIYSLAEETERLMGGMIRYLNKSAMLGSKFADENPL